MGEAKRRRNIEAVRHPRLFKKNIIDPKAVFLNLGGRLISFFNRQEQQRDRGRHHEARRASVRKFLHRLRRMASRQKPYTET
jgi:hypothetical protein